MGALATTLIAAVLIVALFACLPPGELRAEQNAGSPSYVDLARSVPASLQLVVVALIVALAAGVPLGRAARSTRPFGAVCRIVALLTASLPVFWFAAVLQLVALWQHTLPTAGIASAEAFNLTDRAVHVILPTIAFALPLIGIIALMTRVAMPADAVRWPTKGELWAIVARSAPIAIGYDIIIEAIFAWPGIGHQFFNSAGHIDFAITISLLALGTLVVIACNAGVAAQPLATFPTARVVSHRLWFRDRFAIAGAAVLVLVALTVLVPGLLAPASPYTIDLEHWQGYALAPGVAGHFLGTDASGRDLYARLLFGARTSVGIALIAGLAAFGVGALLRTIGTRFGGWTQIFIARAIDAAWSMPPLALVMILVSIVAARTSIEALTMPVVAVAILVALWAPVARSMRAGGSNIAQLLLAIAGALVIEVTVSYLGFGVRPPVPSWGNMLRDIQGTFFSAPWVAISPALCIIVTVASLLALAGSVNAPRESDGDAVSA